MPWSWLSSACWAVFSRRFCFRPARTIRFGLFGYIAILDAGLIVVALHRRWFFLAALAAVGTIFMQIGWASEFFVSGKYFEGDKIFIALAVLLGFNALYLAADLVGQATRPTELVADRRRARRSPPWRWCSRRGFLASRRWRNGPG